MKFYFFAVYLIGISLISYSQNTDSKKHQKTIEASKGGKISLSMDTIYCNGKACFVFKGNVPGSQGLHKKILDLNGNLQAYIITTPSVNIGFSKSPTTYSINFPTTKQAVYNLAIKESNDAKLLEYLNTNKVFANGLIDEMAVTALNGKDGMLQYNGLSFTYPVLTLTPEEEKAAREANTLQGKDIKSIAAMVDKDEFSIPLAKPGGNVPIRVDATLSNGFKLSTKEMGGGRTPWDNYKVEVGTGGTFNNGKVEIIDDARKIVNHKVELTVSSVYQPTLTSKLELPMRYDIDYTARCNGKTEKVNAFQLNGKTGQNGYEGKSGGTTMPGGNGTNGTSGQDGLDGTHGTNGETVEAYIELYSDPILKKDVLRAKVKSLTTQTEKYYIVDPEKGGLIIDASGADGIDGGNGGHGGNGGKGGVGSSWGLAGNGGNGGNGGDGGNGGNGGTVSLHVDTKAQKYLNTAIVVTNIGGKAGKAGQAGAGGYAGSTSAKVQAQKGANGQMGKVGQPGQPGPKPIIKTEVVKLSW